MLDSFRQLDERIFRGEGKKIDWIFLEVHAEGEAWLCGVGRCVLGDWHAAVTARRHVQNVWKLWKASGDHGNVGSCMWREMGCCTAKAVGRQTRCVA